MATLGGGLAVLQAPLLESLSFDPFSLQQNGLAAPEVNVGGREVFQALVIALNMTVLAGCAALCLGFIIVSLLAPALLRPLNLLWFRFSLLLNRIVNPIVLGLMLLVAILPFGLIMQLLRDPLQRNRTKGSTYWIETKPKTSETHSMTNQF